VVIPWFDEGRLCLVKIRRLKGGEPRYVEAFRDRPNIFPGKAAVRVGRPVIIVEGEFDCLLLSQEIGEAVVTLGSSSNRPDRTLLGALLVATHWYVATDADPAGDLAACGWKSRAIRVRPPEGKDWTEFHATGFNRIRYLWGGIIKKPTNWAELATQTWGQIFIDQTLAVEDDYAIEERIAIQNEWHQYA
jgi:hypothetical protein